MMESPASNRRDQRREAILKVASEVFFEEGYAAASMSTIAARLGGSKGTLYNYFKSKEELFEAHIDRQCGLFVDSEIDPILIDARPVTEVLVWAGERLMRHIFSDWNIDNFRLLVTEAKRTPELARVFYQAGPALGIERLTAYLERARVRGAIVTDDCRRAAGHFICLCRNERHLPVILNLTPPPTHDEIKVEIAETVRVFMAAYGPKA